MLLGFVLFLRRRAFAFRAGWVGLLDDAILDRVEMDVSWKMSLDGLNIMVMHHQVVSVAKELVTCRVLFEKPGGCILDREHMSAFMHQSSTLRDLGRMLIRALGTC